LPLCVSTDCTTSLKTVAIHYLCITLELNAPAFRPNNKWNNRERAKYQLSAETINTSFGQQ